MRLEKGSSWNLKGLNEKVRIEDLKASISSGNHKYAKVHTSFISDALKKEIEKGWELLLPLDKATEIPDLVISLMGVVEQLGVSE